MLNREKIIIKIILLAISSLAFIFYSSQIEAISIFSNISTQKINSDTGTIEFDIKLLRDFSLDENIYILLLAVSSDSKEIYEVEIIQDKIVARRNFKGCIVTAFSSQYNFTIGDWYSLKLTWNQATTKFYINNKEVKKIGPVSSEDIPKLNPYIKLGLDDSFEINNFSVSDRSDIFSDSAERKIVEKISCANLSQLLEQYPQEEYSSISLCNFPDRKSREKVKDYIDLLPQDVAKAISKVIFINKERAAVKWRAGLADIDSMSIMLEEKYFDNPHVFFHEVGHVYDAKLNITIGVNLKQSQWVAVSCDTSPLQGKDEKKLSKNSDNDFLTQRGAQSPSEDLADWVGEVYECYIKHKTLADKLNPAKWQYSPKIKKKIDFLLEKGFFSENIYKQVMAKKR